MKRKITIVFAIAIIPIVLLSTILCLSQFHFDLSEKTDAEMWQVDQIVSSPDGKYILYVERVYRGTGVTDDEDVYFKVYSIEDGTSTTIYSGYRQFLLVDWK